jgi:ABC-type glycerol-3-phosphate transport system permease component
MVFNYRTKFGTAIAIAVVASLISVLLALLLLALAGFLIAWGQEPKRTEEFVGKLPFGNHLLKGLAQLDLFLSSSQQ